jgi:hypothetical protein
MGPRRNLRPLPPNDSSIAQMLSPKTLDKLHARRDANKSVVEALRNVVPHLVLLDRREVAALAHRVELCGSRRNQFIATDATNFDTGELFDATGTFWSCGSKLCSGCIADFSRNNRRKLRRALKVQTLKKGERYYFTTFTLPNTNRSIERCRYLMNEVWSRFRKRLLCVSSIRGGCKSEEFTLTKNGIHYHHHHIWKSSYISYQEVRRAWTECAQGVFADENEKLEINTSDGLLIVNVKPVHDLNSLVFELCKYITKSDSWKKLRPRDLAEVALIRRWPRMFELYGSFAPRETHPTVPDAEGVSDSPIVHTSSLTDGSASHEIESWRVAAIKMDPATYRGFLEMQFEEQKGFRFRQLLDKWQFATFVCPL